MRFKWLTFQRSILVLSFSQFLISLLWVLIIVWIKTFSYATVATPRLCSSPRVEELQDTFIPNPDVESAAHGIPVLHLGVQSVHVFFASEVIKMHWCQSQMPHAKLCKKKQNTNVLLHSSKASLYNACFVQCSFEQLNYLLLLLLFISIACFCKPLTGFVWNSNLNWEYMFFI